MQHMHPVLPGLCQNPGDACFMEEFSTSPQTVYQSWCMALHVRSQWQEYPWPLSAISTPQIQRSHPQLTASSLPYANPMPHVTSHAIGQPLSISMATGVFSQWVESLRGRLGGGSRRHTEAWADSLEAMEEPYRRGGGGKGSTMPVPASPLNQTLHHHLLTQTGNYIYPQPVG